MPVIIEPGNQGGFVRDSNGNIGVFIGDVSSPDPLPVTITGGTVTISGGTVTISGVTFDAFGNLQVSGNTTDNIAQVGGQNLVLGPTTKDNAIPVTLATDNAFIPVIVTDGLDVVGTTSRPLTVVEGAPVSIAGSVPATQLGAWSVAVSNPQTAVQLSDGTSNYDLRQLVNLAAEQRTQLYTLEQPFGSAGFIPVPETLPFLGA